MYIKRRHHSAFTLVEIMTGILILSIVIIWGFQAYNWVLVWKIKLIESTEIQKEAFYFSEKFFEEIKRGWTVDYEEYFNRRMVNGNLTGTSLYNKWYYTQPSWFGNYWVNGAIWTQSYGLRYYYCRSANATAKVTDLWCTTWALNTFSWVQGNQYQYRHKQRYGQYSYQFIDYNGNYDSDLWDEDTDWEIIWDDDDAYLWIGPSALDDNWKTKEIYLISADKKLRTYFRWRLETDLGKPSWVAACNLYTGAWGCLGTIEFLKLEWRDWGMNHNKNIIDTDGSQYDWKIDTWIIHEDFNGSTTDVIAGSYSDINKYWQPLFSDEINVSDVEFRVFPHTDVNHAWRDSDPKVNIAPYIQIQMTLSPSYSAQRWIRWKTPEVKINTTISLTDIYSR